MPFEPVYPYIFANEYGPTEATVSITCYNMTAYQPDVPIGTPADNTAIYVVDSAGRRDGLVKIRGFRVELAEVESVVHDFPPVENAAVVACDNPAGGKFIAAYVVSKDPIDKEALAAFIRERKPPYMVPAAIMQIPAIPRNQNGKLNRKALPEPEIYVHETVYVAPQNDIEAELARGFAVALGMDKVSAAEDFFAAGGDSLSIVRLLSECRKLELNFNLIYEGKTPQGIAKLH